MLIPYSATYATADNTKDGNRTGDHEQDEHSDKVTAKPNSHTYRRQYHAADKDQPKHVDPARHAMLSTFDLLHWHIAHRDKFRTKKSAEDAKKANWFSLRSQTQFSALSAVRFLICRLFPL